MGLSQSRSRLSILEKCFFSQATKEASTGNPPTFLPSPVNPTESIVRREGNITKFAFGCIDDFPANFDGSFIGISHHEWGDSQNINETDLARWNFDGEVFGGTSDSFKTVLYTGLPGIVEHIANSLTKYGLDHSDRTVSGVAFVSEIYVAVNWVWFILPVIALPMSILFFSLAVVVNRTQKDELWKCSILPVLYHGLDDRLLEDNPYTLRSQQTLD